MGWVFLRLFFFFNVDHLFKAFIEFVTKLLLFLMFYFFFTVAPNQVSNLYPLHWKA